MGNEPARIHPESKYPPRSASSPESVLVNRCLVLFENLLGEEIRVGIFIPRSRRAELFEALSHVGTPLIEPTTHGIFRRYSLVLFRVETDTYWLDVGGAVMFALSPQGLDNAEFETKANSVFKTLGCGSLNDAQKGPWLKALEDIVEVLTDSGVAVWPQSEW